jgi:hypothetical protein
VRLRYAAAAALRFAQVSMSVVLDLAFDEIRRAMWERYWGMPAGETADHSAQLTLLEIGPGGRGATAAG